MKQAPPKTIEAIVSHLIPPARREDVLGDLHERYRSTAQYLMDAMRTVPHVIVSQIRRTTDRRLVIFEALALYLAFLTVPARPGGRSLIFEPAMLMPLLIPVVVALMALRFIDVYTRSESRTQKGFALQSVMAVALAYGAEELVRVAHAALTLPRGALLEGSALAAFLVWMLRWAMCSQEHRMRPSTLHSAGGDATMLLDIQRQVKEFGDRIRNRNRMEYGAALLVIAFFTYSFAKTTHPIARVGFALIIAGTLYAIYVLRTKGSPRVPPAEGTIAAYLAFHRSELGRQRDLLHRIWLWYSGPFIPGFVVLFTGALLSNDVRNRGVFPLLSSSVVCALIFFAIWKVNQRAERRLQQQIDDLDAMANRQ
jgi:hypothetical protein